MTDSSLSKSQKEHLYSSDLTKEEKEMLDYLFSELINSTNSIIEFSVLERKTPIGLVEHYVTAVMGISRILGSVFS